MRPFSATTSPTNKITYRQDINGMRAWAVLIVLLYHFKIPGFAAGFIGVDIFFVISGFLMTGIIVRGLESDSFKFWHFYMARLRRIAPALMVLIAVLLSLGWFWLPTHEYQALGTQSVYSLSFMSNINFWFSSGYFDTAAQKKWLLHTWSLSIEFQFYLLFPIFVKILWKITPQLKVVFWGLAGVIVSSLALVLIEDFLTPDAAFYLLPARSWELAAGGLAFLLGQRISISQSLSNRFFLFGFSLCFAVALLIHSGFPWPSSWTLLVVLGTVLIILAQRENSILIANPLAQWLGDRSYSIYLWHWPLVVALYFTDFQDDRLWVTGAFALSLLLGNLSYWVIENRTRSYLTSLSFRKQIAILGIAALIIGLAALSVKFFSFENRLPQSMDLVVPIRGNDSFKSCLISDFENCVFNNNQKKLLLVAGDSHAVSIFSAVGEMSNAYGFNPRIYSHNGCPMIEDVKYTSFGPEKIQDKNACKKYFNELLNELEAHKYNKLIIVNRMQYYFNGPNELSLKEYHGVPVVYIDEVYKKFNKQYSQTLFNGYVQALCKLATKVEVVYVFRPTPEMEVDVIDKLNKKRMFANGVDEIKLELKKYDERSRKVWEAQDQAAKQCGIKIINPLPYLCDEQYCYGSKSLKPLYNDTNHLNQLGIQSLMPMFEQIFR